MKECPACKKPIEVETASCEYCGLVFAKWEEKNKPVDHKEVDKEIEAARHEFRKEEDKKHFRIIGFSVLGLLVALLVWFFVRPALPGFERQTAEDFILAVKNSDQEKIRQLTNAGGLRSVEKYGPLSADTLKFFNELIPESYEIISVSYKGKNPIVSLKGKGPAEGSTGKIFLTYEGVLLKVAGQEWDKMEGGFVVLPAYNMNSLLSRVLDEKNAENLNIQPVPVNFLRETENVNRKLIHPFYKDEGRLKIISTISGINNAKVVFSADGRYLLAASTLESKVKIFKTADWTVVKEFDPEFRAESAVAAPDGSAFILGDTYEHGTIIPLTEKGPGNIVGFSVDLGGALKVAVSGNSMMIATGSLQKMLSFWAYPEKVKIMKTELPVQITGIDFSRAAPYFAVSTTNSMFVLWDLRTGKGSPFLVSGITSGITTTAIAISPNGRYVLTGYKDGSVGLTDMENFTNKYVLSSGNSAVVLVRFSADGKVFAIGKSDGKIHLWNTSTGRKLDLLKGHTGSVIGLSFSPAGNYLVSSGEDNKVIVWGYQ